MNTFKKIISILLIVTVVLSLSACSSQIEGSTSMVPGIYTITQDGCYGDFTIEVEVDETSIKDIRITETHDSLYMGQRAQAIVAENAVKHQSVNIDGLTGATVSTETMKNAIRKALIEAGASDDMFLENHISEPLKGYKGDIDEFEPDVIVVGGGITGLTAALTAVDGGAKVLMLEQNKYFGGSTMYSGGYIAAAGGETLSKMGYETDPERFTEWLCDGDTSTFRKDLAIVAGMNSGKALDILTKYGAKWQLGGNIGLDVGEHANAQSEQMINNNENNFAAYLIAENGRGIGIFETTADSIQKFVEDEQMAYLLNTKVVDLITNETGDVIGVITESGDKYYAPATILCSGGYANNSLMLDKQYTRYTLSGAESSIGNMFDASLKVGAVLHDMDYCRTDGGVLPTREGNGWQVEREIKFNTQGAVWLNTDGVRFTKEGSNSRRDYYDTDKNTIYVLMNQGIIDSTDVLYYGNYATFVTDENNEELYRLAEEEKVVFKGNTIEEVAEKAGLNPTVVAAEIEKYNNFCKTGVDDDFGRDASSLISMEEGPFYLFETIPNVKNTYGGLVIDASARVLNSQNEPIVGLYAAGETAGNYNIVRPTASYYGGNLHRGATFGYTAALTAIDDFLN